MFPLDPPPPARIALLPANLESLADARRQLEDYMTVCADAGWSSDSPEAVEQLKLAVTELLANIICHATSAQNRSAGGFLAEPGAAIRMLVRLTERGALRLELVHNGRFFDGNDQQYQSPYYPEESGMGLYLVSQSVDSIRYFPPTAGECCIRIEKQLITDVPEYSPYV